MRYLKVFLAAMTVMFWAPSVMAATVVGIISERSAAEMAAGAHRFLDHNPDHRVLLRTPDQLATQSDQQVLELLKNADAIVLAAVFLSLIHI